MFSKIFSLRIALLGLASWAIPFVAAFAFFDQSGALSIAEPLFKSLMVVIGGAVGVWLLVLAFRHVPKSVQAGFVLGCFWLAMNLALDLALLLPMSGQSVGAWFQDIGLRYFLMPIMAMAMGAVAGR